jgi:hypothetical protein
MAAISNTVQGLNETVGLLKQILKAVKGDGKKGADAKDVANTSNILSEIDEEGAKNVGIVVSSLKPLDKMKDDVGDKAKDLKDTADYYAFAQDKKMLVDSKRAFPLIERGDTLKYVRPTTAPASFNHVRNVNSKTMADFAKERQRILDAAKSTNVLNQKTK